jgi:putative phosphoesterase
MIRRLFVKAYNVRHAHELQLASGTARHSKMAIGQTELPRTLPPTKAYKTVGLISDTHVPTRAKALPQAVFKVFESADYIIHAGDLVELAVVDELEQLAPVLAVHGNTDGPQVSGALPKINSLKIFDWKIGVTHDPGTFYGMNKMREIVKKNLFNVLVYGHTHTSNIKWEGKTLYINPGSPTNPEPPFLCKPTVGLLKITRESIIPEIVQI